MAKKGQLRRNIRSTLDVGSVGMVGGSLFKTGGLIKASQKKEFKGKAPRFGSFKNLGF